MATEQQIAEIYGRIANLSSRIDYCCRDMIEWETHVQIVRLNNNNVNSLSFGGGVFDAPGVIISTFEENVNIGTTRKGLPYEVVFPLKWSDDLYYPVTPERSASNNACAPLSSYNNKTILSRFFLTVQYRYIIDTDKNSIHGSNDCENYSGTNRSHFFRGASNENTSQEGLRVNSGHIINLADDWGPFLFTKENDGTIKIEDFRRNTNFNTIKYYTQWCLNKCADGSLLSDKASEIYLTDENT